MTEPTSAEPSLLAEPVEAPQLAELVEAPVEALRQAEGAHQLAEPVEAPVYVVCGHYGSGKTEFSVSLALREADKGRRVALADLDIVNPYFRSRERAELMEAHGIRVISSMLGHETTIEIPAISPEVRAPLADRSTEVILDMGGDAVGAKILAQFRAQIRTRPHELLIVVNAYRPETATLDGVLRYLDSIQSVAGLRASGLVSNTHLLRDTTADDVRTGLELCREVSRACGVPIKYVAAIPAALDDPPLAELIEATGARKLPIGMHLRDDWM